MLQAIARLSSSIILVSMLLLHNLSWSKPTINWYDNFMFSDPTFTFELIRTLGYSYTGGADLGEGIQTARHIKEGDFHSWYEQWRLTAQRMYQLAQNAENNHHPLSAQQAFFRASNYYRTSGFFMVAPDDRKQSIIQYRRSRDAFNKAIDGFPYIKAVQIPYEKTYLPGYWLSSRKKNAPVVIVNTGFDGTKEELYFEIGSTLHNRGYHVLLIEGPGQGSVLREQQLPFRPDWENVIKPVVDFVVKQRNINQQKIALIGISMGGYLAPRAAAYEPRIKVLIANGGVYNFGQAVLNSLPDSLKEILAKEPEAFDQAMYENMKNNSAARWFFNNGMWTFKVNSPSEFTKKTLAYHMKDSAGKIKARSLIIDSESDTFMKGQAKALFDAIRAPKSFLLFTRQEAAQSHCQMGAIAISNEKVLDWLDKAFQSV